MSRLVLFTTKYEAQLKTNVDAGDVSAYSGDSFDYDDSQTYPMAFSVDDDICDRMFCDSAHEYEDAVILYEALKDIPDVMAADQTFWVSLAHTVFFPFLKRRWRKDDMKSTVLTYWFFENGMMRHGFAGLWWTVRLTVDESLEDKYRLTKVAFWNITFRTRVMGTSIFFRVQNVRTGILSYLADHEELKDGMESKGRFIALHFNRLGATKQLAALPVEYFYKEMEDNLENMNNYNPRVKSTDE